MNNQNPCLSAWLTTSLTSDQVCSNGKIGQVLRESLVLAVVQNKKVSINVFVQEYPWHAFFGQANRKNYGLTIIVNIYVFHNIFAKKFKRVSRTYLGSTLNPFSFLVLDFWSLWVSMSGFAVSRKSDRKSSI